MLAGEAAPSLTGEYSMLPVNCRPKPLDRQPQRGRSLAALHQSVRGRHSDQREQVHQGAAETFAKIE